MNKTLLEAYNILETILAFYETDWADAYDYLNEFVLQSLVSGNFSMINTLCIATSIKDYPKELLEILYITTEPGKDRLPSRKMLENKINPPASSTDS